ncbi:hypothetical protein PIB30_077825 [Stylosanthes scabra]|uniref:Uncharacterized protein n=1 Tax=Stylosanthes scabra TaxID=79078 RepID=A0ABU6XNN3_9FABA|nr:hypothetical protein [Stylosanthes scabra]
MGEVVDQSANIHQDVLNEIAKRIHSYDDYLQLRLVCKPNNKTWLELPGNDMYQYFQDVIFLRRRYMHDNGQLYEFDAKTCAEPVGGIHEATPPSDIVTLGEICNIKYLIGCDDGSLLMIIRHLNMRRANRTGVTMTVKFDIYELKKNSKCGQE